MLIDDIIKQMENKEKYWKSPSYKDPYQSGVSLHNLMALSLRDISLEANQRFRTSIYLLENTINNLILIVQRLRKELELPLQEGSQETKNLHFIQIDIQSFFHFSYSILLIIAGLTPRFYPRSLQGLPSRSFRKQRNWLIKNEDVDPEYSKYLIDKTSWFEEFSPNIRG